MELKGIHRVYFIGIGGIGMSALARYFLNRGCMVYGYDKTNTHLTALLEEEGAIISYADDLQSLPASFLTPAADGLVIYTPAIPVNSALLTHFRQNGFTLKKRSEVLGDISRGMFCIAVAGTHGKTTTSAMIAHILTETGHGCTAFLGGIATNYDSNILFSNTNVMVVEADEYDRSFLTLHPDIAVITSMDADHLDIYGDEMHLQESFKLFALQRKPGGKLFVKKGLPISNSIAYAASGDAEHRATSIRVEHGHFVFDYIDSEVHISNIRLMTPGIHNVENAVVAIAVGLSLNIPPLKIKQAVECFKGVKRRFETILNAPNHIYIDDYAHHPAELAAAFGAVRQLYPDKQLTVVFQPHLFSRTRDFANNFAEVLSTVDALILLEIYPARELPLEGINSKFLLDKITLVHKELSNKSLLTQRIAEMNPELLLTVGAGDIDTMVEPLKNILNHA